MSAQSNSDRAADALGAAVQHDPAGRHVHLQAPRGNDAVFGGILVMVLVVAAKVLFRRRLAKRHVASLDLVVLAVGFCLLLMMRLPITGAGGWVGGLLFVGLAVVYRLLGQFEEPPTDDS